MEIKILSRYEFSKQYKKMNEKTENQSYSYGCIMGYFDEDPMVHVTADTEDYNVKDEDIYDNEDKEYGREIEPHVTILYGLHDDEIEEEDVIEFLKVLKMPIVKFNDISCFTNDEYDVLKWDVEKTDLEPINKLTCKLFPFTNKYPDYHPHCTIAYLKPGMGEKYSGSPNNIVNLKVKQWVYSQANGRKIAIDETGTMIVIREASDENTIDN